MIFIETLSNIRNFLFVRYKLTIWSYIIFKGNQQERHHNGQKDKQRSTKHTYTTKDQVTQTPLKIGDEVSYTWRVTSSCSISYICRVTLIINPEIKYEWGKDRKCLRQAKHIRGQFWENQFVCNIRYWWSFSYLYCFHTFHIAFKIHKTQSESDRFDYFSSVTNSNSHVLSLVLRLEKFDYCSIMLTLLLFHSKPMLITCFGANKISSNKFNKNGFQRGNQKT